MKPDELLKATQQAIGDATLYELHRELIAARKDLREVETVRHAALCLKHLLMWKHGSHPCPASSPSHPVSSASARCSALL